MYASFVPIEEEILVEISKWENMKPDQRFLGSDALYVMVYESVRIM